MAVPTSQEAVLSTVELLEAIFLQLPLQDLLINALRVNRTWNEEIKTSTVLQQKLFFQAWPKSFAAESERNPLLEAVFPPWFGGIVGVSKPRRQRNCYGSFEDMKWTADADSRKAVLRKDASWRRMFPMQPPPQYLNVVKSCYGQMGDWTVCGGAHFPEGMRMCKLYDFVEEEVSTPITSFSIIWHDRDSEKFEDGRENLRETIGVCLHYTMQCCDGWDEGSRRVKGMRKLK